MVGARIINIREIICFSCLGIRSLIDFPFENNKTLNHKINNISAIFNKFLLYFRRLLFAQGAIFEVRYGLVIMPAAPCILNNILYILYINKKIVFRGRYNMW